MAADSNTLVCEGPGNKYPVAKTQRVRKRRRRHKKKVDAPSSDTSLMAGAIASKSWKDPVTIWGQKIRFLVDSGSDVTILPNDRYRAIPRQFRPSLTPLRVPVYGASGHPLTVLGTCQVPIGVGTEVIRVDCTVVDGGICPILGMNFMREQEVPINFGTGEMRFGNATLCLTGPRLLRPLL